MNSATQTLFTAEAALLHLRAAQGALVDAKLLIDQNEESKEVFALRTAIHNTQLCLLGCIQMSEAIVAKEDEDSEATRPMFAVSIPEQPVQS